MTTSQTEQAIGLVFCADNDKEALGVREAALGKHGYEVVTAESAREAFDAVKTHSVRIALLDYQTGATTSEALAIALKERDPRTAIILDGCSGEVPEALLWLVDDYVLKSEPTAVLLQVVEKASKERLSPRNRKAATAA
jgi:DNA-binding NtrC family response regulator